MISSDKGLEIFRNWKTHNTLLWLVSVPDEESGLNVRVVDVSSGSDPSEVPRVDLKREGTGAQFSIDLVGAMFERTRLFPFAIRGSSGLETTVPFLEISFTDERRFVFAELLVD